MILYIIAHLLGDWVFQPRKMAVKKGEQTWQGWAWCLLHVTLYTLMFYILVPNQTAWFYLSIFVPHFIIDKWSLMGKWQKLRDGEYWWQTYQTKRYDYKEDEFYHRIEMAFAGLRYAVEDNTAHLICLYLSFQNLAK